MVVAGRVITDDVAIMMVEAEATENIIELVAGGAQAPTEAVVAEGLEAAKPFIRALCEAQQELAEKAAKPTGDFPVFPDYGDDVYYAVSSVATDALSEALTIAGKHERDDRTDEIKAEVLEQLAEQFAGRDHRDRRRLPLGHQEAGPPAHPDRPRSGSTAAGSPTSARCRPRSA